MWFNIETEIIKKLKQRAKENLKTIVLPEATDLRTLEATDKICREGFCKIILIGNEKEILSVATENKLDISNAKIVNPKNSEKYNEYVNAFYELRKAKGITKEQAEEMMLDSVYFGVMMVKQGDADGLVSGAIHSTADTLRPALQIVKTAPGTKLVSSFSVMVVPNCEYGENGVFIFSDCGLNQNPTAEELSEIAISASKSFELIVEKEPRIAMLSYSTYGSAKSESVEKMQEATRLVKEKAKHLKIDGEMQFDSAVVDHIGKSKAPGSEVAGRANTMIFPNLDAGNIGYKLVERLAKAEVYGPICQGMAKPINDLSRGCKSDDIVGVVAITAIQAQNIGIA